MAGGASVIGPRHADLGEPNQDAMTVTGWRAGWIGAVADGLGSRTRSDLGARRACQVSRRLLRSVAGEFDLRSTLPFIHQKWLDAIRPAAPKDAATTLIFARVMAEGHVHAAQLGDGLLLLRCGGKFYRVTPDRAAYGNQTWAMGAVHEQDRWVCAEGQFSKAGDGVVMMTDGVADDLKPDQLEGFFDAVYRAMLDRSRRGGRRWLQTEFSDWATPLHSDDKTLVGIFRKSK